jgi:uncharacterized integral membrane protein
MRGGRWLILAAVVLFSGLFAYYNAGERTTLNLGFTVLYRISLVRLILGSFILGMIAMFLVGLRQDLRLRRYLQGLEAPRAVSPPRIDPPARPEYDGDDARWAEPVRTPPRAESD